MLCLLKHGLEQTRYVHLPDDFRPTRQESLWAILNIHYPDCFGDMSHLGETRCKLMSTGDHRSFGVGFIVICCIKFRRKFINEDIFNCINVILTPFLIPFNIHYNCSIRENMQISCLLRTNLLNMRLSNYLLICSPAVRLPHAI